MKKLITTIVIIAMGIISIHSQIVRPKVNVNTNKVNTKPAVQGLRVANLDKMSVKDFVKLKIPLAQVIKEKANAKAIRTSRITPLSLNGGLLKYLSFYGMATPKTWQIGEWDYYPHLLEFSFRFSADVYYNLRLKPRNEVTDDAKITLCEEVDSPYGTFYSNCVDALQDSQGEFIFTLMKRDSKVVKFSLIGYQRSDPVRPFNISEIRMDRLN